MAAYIPVYKLPHRKSVVYMDTQDFLVNHFFLDLAQNNSDQIDL